MSEILVIGDVIVDAYITGTATRISPEAPVPIVNFQNLDYRPGGAANVAENIRTMEGSVTLIGVLGKDTPPGVEFAGGLFVTDFTRTTTVKTRIVANGQQMIRIDTESREPINSDVAETLLHLFETKIQEASIVVISDYNKGVITHQTAPAIISIAKRHKAKIIVDPKKNDFTVYDGATVITPNREEWRRAWVDNVSTDTAILVTLGADGMELHHRGHIMKIPARAREVIDVTGAGDTVVAALAVYLAEHPACKLTDAASFANLAAAVVVGKHGTATATLAEIEALA